MRFLRGAGCRPSEAYHVVARYYRPTERRIVYSGHPAADEYSWKNAKQLDIPPAPTCYGFRHSYATDWLLNAGSIKVLADLIGSTRFCILI